MFLNGNKKGGKNDYDFENFDRRKENTRLNQQFDEDDKDNQLNWSTQMYIKMSLISPFNPSQASRELYRVEDTQGARMAGCEALAWYLQLS